MNKKYFEELAQFILKNIKGDYLDIHIGQNNTHLSRFADKKIHQSVFQNNIYLTINLFRDQKYSSISTNQLDKEHIKELLKELEKNIKNIKKNPDLFFPNKGNSFEYNDKYDEKTANIDVNYSAKLIGQIFDKGKKYSAEISGSLRLQTNQLFMANSYGNIAYNKNTLFHILIIPRRDESTTYNAFTSYKIDDFNSEKFIEKPLKRLDYYQNHYELDRGKYDVILEEFSAGNIFTNFAYMALNAEAYAENRSYLSSQLGKKVLGENINLFDDYTNPLTIGYNFDMEFQKRQKLTLFENGIFKQIPMNTKYAQKTNLPITGHSLWNFVTALPINMVLQKGNKDKNKLIEGVEDGLLITRFHYTNTIDPKETTFTGMTRNGVFVIKNGKIVGTGNNLRFTINIVETLNNVVGIENKQYFYYNGWLGGIVIPNLHIKNFNFSSKTNF